MTQRDGTFKELLNIGCGRCYHTDWTNIDLVASGPEVRQHDLRRGLPYADGSFDAVYHSHVLEHLTPEDAAVLLGECRRVLRMGGVVRIAVPDLEGIARAYLDSIDEAEHGGAGGRANHYWMTLELIDQLTRQRGGGRMGQLMRDPDLINRDFVRSRIGGEMGAHKNDGVRKTLSQRISRVFSDVRKQLALAAVTILDGSTGRAAYREGRFRQSGEIHRWMYDRVSLAALLHSLGFADATVCATHESRIPDFDSWELDRDGSVARKPDSLYMEAIKSAMPNQTGLPAASSNAA